MGLISGWFTPQPPPPPRGGGDNGGAGQSGGAGQAGGAGATGGTAQTGAGSGDANGSGSSADAGSTTGSGTGNAPPASGSSTGSNPVAPRRPVSLAAEKTEEPATLRRDDVITGQERLDLAFAGSLTEEQVRRYAEVGRLTVITQQQFDRLDVVDAGAKLAEGAATVRGFDGAEEAPRYERRV